MGRDGGYRHRDKRDRAIEKQRDRDSETQRHGDRDTERQKVRASLGRELRSGDEVGAN